MPNRSQLTRLVERARLQPPLAAALVFPVDRDSLQLASSGAFAGYLAPALVGPEARIRDAAAKAGLDISRMPIIDTADDPRLAAERAVALAGAGNVGALVKGALDNDAMLAPVADPRSGLRTDCRLSHAYFLDLPGFPRGLLLADALLNVNPNLAAKRDILANTLQLALALGIVTPHVALLAARNVVSPAFPSTSEAAALKSMAAQGLLGGAIVDGPMTPDVALSEDAAHQQGANAQVAGRADILLAPTMESATMVLRTLTGLSGGLAAGLVLGAKVPIVLPASRDTMEVRMASCVMASLVASAVRGATLGVAA